LRAFSNVAFKSLLNSLCYHLCILFLSVKYICNIWSFRSIPYHVFIIVCHTDLLLYFISPNSDCPHTITVVGRYHADNNLYLCVMLCFFN
jgi:hypothetical protein